MHGMPRTVLVVDDSAAFQATARTLLMARGYEVVGVAVDVAGALEAARELLPDCVLLDVNLPDGDGASVADAFTAATVVLVSTSAPSVNSAGTCRSWSPLSATPTTVSVISAPVRLSGRLIQA